MQAGLSKPADPPIPFASLLARGPNTGYNPAYDRL